VLTYAQKEEAVAELKGKLARAKSVIVADYRGLDVPAVNELRSRLRGLGSGECEYHVVKNSILRRAAEGSDVASITEHFRGPTAIAISYGDPVGLARTLVEYAKVHEKFEVKAGVLDGRAIGNEEIGTLATLPSLDQLRARLVGLIQAPAQKLAAVLQAPAAQLARLAEARRASLEEGGA
jgi:large subunit ribosomal protein L10